MIREESEDYVGVGFVPPDKVPSFEDDGNSRAWVRGVNVGRDGVEHPRLGRVDFDTAVVPDDLELDDGIFKSILGLALPPGSHAYQEYVKTHVGVRRQEGDRGAYTTDFCGNLGLPPAGVPEKDMRVSTVTKKKFSLAQIFFDTYVAEKYGITAKQMASLRLKATGDPASAAKEAQELLQLAVPEGVQVSVNAGSYAYSEKAAVEEILQVAGANGPRSVTVVAKVIGNDMLLDMDSDLGLINVTTPLKHAESAMRVYALVERIGPHQTMYLLGLPTMVLGIEVFVDNQCVSSSILGHCADGLLREQEVEPAELTDAVRAVVEEVGRNVLPLEVHGEVVASAVQLEAEAVLVNQHVIEQFGDVTLRGSPLAEGQPMADDLWAFSSAAKCQPWSVRNPSMGEIAAILYRDGTGLRLSPALRVVSTAGQVVVLDPVQRFDGVGMSGGALIGVRDGALLAVHRGATATRFVATMVTPALRADVASHLQALGRYKTRDGTSDAIVEEAESRGLGGRLVAVVEAVKPVQLSDEYVGSAVNLATGLCTTVRPGAYDSVVFVPQPSGPVSVAPVDKDLPVVPVLRRPERYEKVFLVGKDKNGVFVSRETAVVQVAPSGSGFFLRDVGEVFWELRGAVVVALQDMAVLGAYVSLSSASSMGTVLICSRFPENNVVQERDLFDGLGAIFPRLTLSAWDKTAAQRAFNHASLHENSSMMAEAMIGDAALRLCFFQECQLRGFHSSTWQVRASAALSNARLARVAERFGLDRLVRTQVGLSLSRGSKTHADVLEALVALAARFEGSQDFVEFLRSIGLLDMDVGVVSYE